MVGNIVKGDVVQDLVGGQLAGIGGIKNGAELDLAQQSNLANEEVTGGTDGAAGSVIGAIGTDSLFNPFQVFRYSKFATGTDLSKYDVASHKLTYQESASKFSFLKSSKELKKQKKEAIENPSAIKIIEWANARANSPAGPIYPYPYAINDFLWCKWYGKIPNNRLLTLRRYTIPVEDNLQIDGSKLPLVPIAQAVSWFGEGTGNSLTNILGITYGFNWSMINSEMTDVVGNELKVEDLIQTLGVTNPTAQQALKLAFARPDSPFEFSGYDKTLNQFTKDSWTHGSYWNRVRGPVNVIHQTEMRTRGFSYIHNIKLDFEYNLRSYGSLNPRVALLDLIGNMLSLTSNNAQFWGGGNRYFKQTGPLLAGFNSTGMEQGDMVDGAQQVLSTVGQLISEDVSGLKNFVDKLQNATKDSKDLEETAKTFANEVTEKFKSSNVGQGLIASRLASMHQTPLVMRALLDGRAVGEWHLMVGNPMDPIAVIGNLCLDTTTIAFSDDLGHDDFPNSVKFTINLKPGRPRAKQDIASMFNYGGGDFHLTPLQPPSSAFNSFGDYTSSRLAMASSSSPGIQTKELATIKTNLKTSAANAQGNQNLKDAEKYAKYFRQSVAGRYGSGFGKSPILSDYFLKLQTKD